jgi:hypothetical protein
MAYWFRIGTQRLNMGEAGIQFGGARVALLRQALVKEPEKPELLFRLADALANSGDARETVELFRRVRERALLLIDAGSGGAGVIATLAIAEALLGRIAEVRRLVDYGRFFKCSQVEAPEGFCAAGFHRLLADEIKADLKFYDEPGHRAIRKGWRNNCFFRSRLPASLALNRLLRHHVDRYIASLPGDPDNPFVASRPPVYRLEGWAVVSDGASHHKSHIHPRAWLSGVYYVVRPAVSLEAGTGCGWLQVGPPEWNRVLAGWDRRTIEPEPGNLVLMPGYFYHHTTPMGIDEERICVAFDVVPGDMAAGIAGY